MAKLKLALVLLFCTFVSISGLTGAAKVAKLQPYSNHDDPPDCETCLTVVGKIKALITEGASMLEILKVLHDGCELLGEGVGDTCVTLATVGWDLFIAIVDANTAEDICSAFLECKK